MTDEENKAIKDCDSIFICLDDAMSEDSANDYRKSYKILKNLIEKQSKEIEHQKEKRENQKKELAILNAKQVEFNKLVNTLNSYKGQFKRQQKEIEELKDKIKTIIEELQEDIKYSANPLSIDNSKFAIKVLQSLLRKEFPTTITKEELEKRWKE